MITKIYIDGFKSFVDFSMDFAPYTVIAGLNASGKSNLFDALKLLSRLSHSDNIKSAFSNQRGELHEVFTKLAPFGSKDSMKFVIEFLLNRYVEDAWGNRAELKYTRLRYELILIKESNAWGGVDVLVDTEKLQTIKQNDDHWIKRIDKNNINSYRPLVKTGKRGVPYMFTKSEGGVRTVIVPQDGGSGSRRRFPLNKSSRTILSSIDSVEFPHMLAVKEEMKGWNFLELSPMHLRQPTDKATGIDELSPSGKHLAAVLQRIRTENPYAIDKILFKLQKFVPGFTKLDVEDDLERNRFTVVLEDKNAISYTSRVLSEGTLRILALCTLAYDMKSDGLICFEEPENGIHPNRIRDMYSLLSDLAVDLTEKSPEKLKQVIINTHSPEFIKLIYNNKHDVNTSLYYTDMSTSIASYDSKRFFTSVTKILPVNHNPQFSIQYSKQQSQLSVEKVAELLRSHKETF